MMRKSLLCLSMMLLVVLAGCVTINVYFPKAAAEKAADQFIGSVIDGNAQPAGASSSSQPTPSSDDESKPSTDAGHEKPMASRVLDFLIPAAYAGDTPDLRIHTSEVNAIHERMRQRYRESMHQLLDDGVVGFTSDGLVAVRQPSSIPLSRRAMINSTVAAENADRKALYQDIAEANDHPDWADKIRRIFAEKWIDRAHAGWYYQTADGTWKQK